MHDRQRHSIDSPDRGDLQQYRKLTDNHAWEAAQGALSLVTPTHWILSIEQ